MNRDETSHADLGSAPISIGELLPEASHHPVEEFGNVSINVNVLKHGTSCLHRQSACLIFTVLRGVKLLFMVVGSPHQNRMDSWKPSSSVLWLARIRPSMSYTA